MEEINKNPDDTFLRRFRPFFRALGLYALVAAGLTFFWSGSLLNLFFLLAALAIFWYSFFDAVGGFFILLIFRTAFDSLGSVTALFNWGGLAFNFTFLLGLIMIVIAARAAWQGRRRLFNNKIFYPWLFFLFLNAVLSFFSFDFSASLVSFFRWLSFFSAFVFGYLTFDSASKLTRLAKVVIFSAIIPAVVAWWQLANGTGFYDGDRWRLDGTFTHPNMLALYLVLAISLSLFVSLNLRRGSLARVIYGLLAGFFVVPLIFTYTRIAWLALAFILLVVGIYRFRKMLLITVAGVVLIFLLWPAFQTRVLSLTSLGAADSSSWRLNLWQNIITYIEVKPWFGYGPGTAAVFLGQNIPQLAADTEPHNDFLRVWLESGVFALLTYLWIFTDYLKRLWRGFKAETRPRLKMLALFSGLFTLAILGASMTDNVVKDAVMQWDFWALSGGLLAVLKILPVIKKRQE